MTAAVKKLLLLAGSLILLWLLLRPLMGVALPFLLGGLLALAAEPAVRPLSRKLPRGVAAGIGVSAALVLTLCLLFLLAAIAVRELGRLAAALPDLGQTALQGIASLQTFLLELAQKAPEGLRSILHSVVNGLFSGSSAMVDEITRRLPGIATAILGQIPGSALSVGTGIFSAYMISARLPRIRSWLRTHTERAQLRKGLAALKKLRQALLGWLKAQLKLSGVCFLTVTAGLLLLRIPYAPLWAILIAVVDAVPVLGTGTVLLPWSLICLIQGQSARALGLLGLWGISALSRSALEPRFLGKQLGLDPLVTLLCLYAGYQFWGVGGIVLSPLLSVAVTELAALFRRQTEA